MLYRSILLARLNNVKESGKAMEAALSGGNFSDFSSDEGWIPSPEIPADTGQSAHWLANSRFYSIHRRKFARTHHFDHDF